MDSGVENKADRLAASWVAHLDRHGGDESQHPELASWLQADQRNRGAFVRARAAWLLMGDSGAGAVVSSPDAVDPAHPSVISRRAAMGGLSATALILTTFGLAGIPARTEAYSTKFGEIRRFRLADGSTMTLDTDTRIEARVDSSRREVIVRSGGAFFEVQPQLKAPFIVTGAEFRVQGAEASFFVNSAHVIVTSGQVDLERLTHESRDPYRLKRGTLASFGRNGLLHVSNISEDTIARSLAWREGGISLDGETVAEAARLFNRYNRRQISVAEASLANQKIVGWFQIDRPRTFAQAVATAFDSEIVENENSIQIVRQRNLK